MQTKTLISTLSVLALASSAAIEKRLDVSGFNMDCGCDGQEDADVSDCQLALEKIDTSKPVIDIMNSVDGEKDGLWSYTHNVFKVGTCAIGLADIIEPGLPRLNGNYWGTLVSGKDLRDLVQRMVDECGAFKKFPAKVNACAAVGSGNVVLRKVD